MSSLFRSTSLDIPAARAFSRPTWAEIDLEALRHNIRTLASRPNTRSMLGVLKADAYGHGAQTVAKVLCEAEFVSIKMLGVASVDEGCALRNCGINAPILLLSAILPEEAEAVIAAHLTPTVFTREVAQSLHDAASDVLPIHLKIDTGMHRLGVAHQEAARFANELRQSRLKIEGVYTHFASADSDEEFTLRQLKYFEAALRACDFRDGEASILHAANSAAHLRFPQSRFDMVRPGIALYGLWPSPIVREIAQNEAEIELQPVMSLRSRVTHIQRIQRGEAVSYGATWRAERPSTIAVVAVGYADGYPRLASNQGKVLWRGQLASVVGRVTMDQIMVDATDIETETGAKLQIGETVTLWGRDGESSISLDDVASWVQTISYEIACGVSARVPRIEV